MRFDFVDSSAFFVTESGSITLGAEGPDSAGVRQRSDQGWRRVWVPCCLSAEGGISLTPADEPSSTMRRPCKAKWS
jgi:hypothetical protein